MNTSRTLRRRTNPLPTLRLLVVLGLAVGVCAPAARAARLADLPPARAEAIGDICLPVQFRDGAQAYRECIDREVERAAGADASASGQAGSDASTATSRATLASLEFDERYATEQYCKPALAEPGSAFAECVEDQVATAANEPAADLSALRDDERHAVQRSCFGAQSSGGLSSFRRCLADETDAMRRVPVADVDDLDLLERNALQAACSADERSAAEYRRCLLARGDFDVGASDATAVPAASVARADDAPETSPDAGISPDADTLPAAPDPSDTAVSDEVDRTIASPSDPVPEIARAEPAAQGESAPAARGELAPADRDDPANAAANEAPIDRTGDAAIGADPVDGDVGGVPELLERSVAGLDGVGRIALLAAAALPLLLLGAWFVSRRRAATEDSYPSVPVGYARRTADDERQPEPTRAPVRWNNEDADDFLDELDEMDATVARGLPPGFAEDEALAFDAPETSPEPAAPEPAAPVPAAPIPASPVPAAPGSAASRPRLEPDVLLDDTLPHDPPSDPSTALSHLTDPAPTAPDGEPGSTFARWLESAPEDKRREYVSEFLIYWIAYGDERYEPALKRAVLQASEPDAHTAIKRWVLQEDVTAFADATRWLVANAGDEQRARTLELLMVLLLPDGQPTPVQNTVLRFLADAFGFGHEWLEALYAELFQARMPRLPRVDRADWWDGLDPTDVERWGERTGAAAAPEERDRVLLGLPPGAALDAERLHAARDRAVDRFDPSRFDALGQRERGLVARQREKIEEACDRLLDALGDADT